MSDVLSDAYWTDEFEVTEADLDRIAKHIEESGAAQDLTTLAKRVIRGRVRYGAETSAPARQTWSEDPSVRLWDPAGEWEVGDHIVFAALVSRGTYQPLVGEITEVEPEFVRVDLDRRERAGKLWRSEPGSEKAKDWHRKVREVVESKRRSADEAEQAEGILLQHAERVASHLLEALRADERFVRLAGRWFLGSLAEPPTGEQITALAWAMLEQEEPQPTEELRRLVEPPLPEGDAHLFGLYLALRDRPEVFRNADPGQRPRWELAGPPPGSCMPRRAAYDPDTYEVLCVPGEQVPPEVVARLWELDLLRAVR